MVVITEYPVMGGYGLGSAIVEPKAGSRCWERRRVRVIDEGPMDGMKKYAKSTIISCSRTVRAQLDCYGGKAPR